MTSLRHQPSSHMRPLALAVSALVATTLAAPAAPVAAQTVPATCSVNATAGTLTCTTTVNLSGVTGTFSNNTLTLSPSGSPPPAPTTAPVCTTGVTPTTQQVNQNALATTLSANCSGAASYKWFSGGNEIPGATASTYQPATVNVGSTAYTATATNTVGTTNVPSSGTVTVVAAAPPPSGGGCPAGEPRVNVNFSQGIVNFTYNSIVGNGIHVTKLVVANTDSTRGKINMPSFGITQDDTTTFSNRTVTVSQTCNDFSANARVIFADRIGGNFNVVTADDTSRITSTVPGLSPGTWYINVRNDTCPAGTNCSITGNWRNWNK
jgi:hypothetical protein